MIAMGGMRGMLTHVRSCGLMLGMPCEPITASVTTSAALARDPLPWLVGYLLSYQVSSGATERRLYLLCIPYTYIYIMFVYWSLPHALFVFVGMTNDLKRVGSYNPT